MKLKGRIDRCGPCPVCGGVDRFSINIKKQVWNCRGCDRGGDVIDLVKHLDHCDFVSACGTLTGEPPPAKPNGPKGKDRKTPVTKKIVAACFDYTDETGTVLFQVQRIEFQNADGTFVAVHGKRKKTFRQGRPDPNRPGKWIWNVDEVRPVPYRLGELNEALANGQVVLVVEGERKADLLREWNIAATCCAGGSGKWCREHSAFLQGADVLILPDQDDAGCKHTDVVGASLQGVAASVRVLQLPGLRRKEDVVDWAKAGHTADEPDRCRGEAMDASRRCGRFARA
jgi:hypothetical protein